jgi:hypothetical protein
LDLHAHLQALRACPGDAPYIAISLIGSMGGAPLRRQGGAHIDYARQVADFLEASIDLASLITQADDILTRCLVDGGIIPTQRELAESGESSTGRAGEPSSNASSSAESGPATPAGGGA